MKYLNPIIFFILLLFLSSFVFSQDVKKVNVKLRDAKTKQPINDATIYLLPQEIIAKSSLNGDFFFISKFSKQTVIISHVSYQKYQNVFDMSKIDTLLIIYLKKKNIEIKQVAVYPQNNTELILQAFENVPFNYPDKPIKLSSYFKETISCDDTIIQQYEAIIETYKAPYNTKEKDNLKIVKGRFTVNKKDDELWKYLYFINAPYEILFSDVAKYPTTFIQVPNLEINFLKENHFKHYTYTNKDSLKKYHVINFEPNRNTRRGVFKGKIVLEKKSLAIVSMQYQYAENRLSRIQNFPSETEINLSEHGVFIPDISYFSKIEYAKYNGEWIVSSVIMTYSFEFKVGFYSEPKIITVRDQMYVTNIKNEGIEKINFWHQINRNDRFVNKHQKNDTIIPVPSSFFPKQADN